MVTKRQNIVQLSSNLLNLKMLERVSKMISAEGALKPTYTAENIERVRYIIEEDPHATHEIIEAVTSINHLTINEIIHNALKKRN